MKFLKPLSWLALLGAGGAAAGIELFYRTRENQPCRMLPKQRTPWTVEAGVDRKVFHCTVPIRNFNYNYETTVVDVRPAVRLLAKGMLPEDIRVSVSVKPLHKESRDDGYWPAYILTPLTTLDFELRVECTGNVQRLDELHALVVRLDYEIYSRREKQYRHDEIILIPEQEVKAKLEPVTDGDAVIFPVKTHILTDMDTMAEVVERYVKPISQEGDVIVMAESVVAITQRRYRLPEEIQVGFWARRLCYLIPNVGSLSSRYGMQSAIDEVGLPRMLTAVGVGALMKLAGQPGWLYRIAGLPSELIDDVTGTMPPYDKYLVLGPANPQAVVDEVKARTGLDAVIADVNNLKRACILAATAEVDRQLIEQKLLSNPLGNASEQTPIVLIRFPKHARIKSQADELKI